MPTVTATLDFGVTPADEASVTVTGLTSITAGSKAEAYVMRQTSADHGLDEHDMLAFFGRFTVGDIVAGTSAVIRCFLNGAKATGRFSVELVHNP